jgi:hypothetical protein
MLQSCGDSGSLISMSGALYVELSNDRISSYPASPTSPTDINPNAPDEAWENRRGQDAEEEQRRINALCQAVRRIVDAACEAEITRREIGAVGIDAIAGVVGVGLAFAGPAAAALGGLLLVGVSAAAGAFAALSESVLSDDDARENVACCGYRALLGKTPSAASLGHMFDHCCFAGGSPEAQVAGAIAPLMEDLYKPFVDFISEAERELGLECPCSGLSWRWQVDPQDSPAGAKFEWVSQNVARITTGTAPGGFTPDRHEVKVQTIRSDGVERIKEVLITSINLVSGPLDFIRCIDGANDWTYPTPDSPPLQTREFTVVGQEGDVPDVVVDVVFDINDLCHNDFS